MKPPEGPAHSVPSWAPILSQFRDSRGDAHAGRQARKAIAGTAAVIKRQGPKTTLAVVGALVVSGCGSERTPEAYCKAFYDRAAPFRSSFADADPGRSTGDFASSLAQLITAPGDLATIFEGMSDHAPDEIRAETEAVRDGFQRMQDQIGDSAADPLGGLAGSLVNGLSMQRELAAVDAYLQENCAVDSALGRRLIDEAGGGG